MLSFIDYFGQLAMLIEVSFIILVFIVALVWVLRREMRRTQEHDNSFSSRTETPHIAPLPPGPIYSRPLPPTFPVLILTEVPMPTMPTQACMDRDAWVQQQAALEDNCFVSVGGLVAASDDDDSWDQPQPLTDDPHQFCLLEGDDPPPCEPDDSDDPS